MTQFTVSKPVEAVPAVAAVTTNNVTVLEVRENYGWNYDPTQPGGFFGPGRPQSVEATVMLSTNPPVQRTFTVWEGDAYLAVRGKWTDEDLANQLATVLSGSAAATVTAV
jgi:hypothetical protein